MKISCTLNDLVLYLYNETNITESVLVQHAIDHDEEVAETYSDLIKARKLLNTLQQSPSQESVDNIMAYSASLVKEIH